MAKWPWAIWAGPAFRLTYDPNQIELIFNPAVEQRALSQLSLGHQRPRLAPIWRSPRSSRGISI